MAYYCPTCELWYTNTPYAIVGETSYCCFECVALKQGLTVGKHNANEHLNCREHVKNKGDTP